jgi:hypothetical protein
MASGAELRPVALAGLRARYPRDGGVEHLAKRADDGVSEPRRQRPLPGGDLPRSQVCELRVAGLLERTNETQSQRADGDGLDLRFVACEVAIWRTRAASAGRPPARRA